MQVCRGLAFAHEHGVVHRDIKPSNIRLLDDGTAKILDFGIAKLGSTNLTKTGMMVGTVHYMSPEQAQGKPLDGRTDIFSVGVILYELLAGRRPFRGEGITDVLYKIVHEPAEPLDVASLGLDPRLAEIVGRALEKDCEKRYPTAGAIADAIQTVLGEMKREGLPPTAAEPLSMARRLLKEGRVEEGLTRLRTLAEATPTSLEVRRALRAATRDLQQKQAPAERSGVDFPELEATFAPPQPRPPPPSRRPPWPTRPAARSSWPGEGRATSAARSVGGLLAMALVLALLGGGVAVLLLRGPGAAAPAPSVSPPGPDAKESVGATPQASPPGASPLGASSPAVPEPSLPSRPSGKSVLLPVITDPPGSRRWRSTGRRSRAPRLST